MAAVLDINGRIRWKSRSCTKQVLMTDENMIIKWHIRLKQNTEIFWGVTNGEITSDSGIMLITYGLIFLELKRRYSVLLRLADNLLATNQEKTSLMQDSITDTADDACLGANEIYIWVSSA